jgi:hypothetical protein
MTAPLAAPWRRFTGANAAWLLAAASVIHILLWQVSEPPALFSDFYKANWTAGETLWKAGLEPVFPFTGAGNWSNLPIIAWPFVPLLALGKTAAGWTFLAIGYAAVATACAMLVREARDRADIAVPLMLLFLVNGPLLNSLREGNTTHFILLLLVIAVHLWRRRMHFAAGLVLGVCATVKLPLLLFGVYFVLRGRWRIVAGGAMAVFAMTALSVAVFGFESHVVWYQQFVAPFLGAFMPAFNVQSVNGFLMRLTTGASLLYIWTVIDPSLLQRIAQLAVMALLYGATFWLLRRGRMEARAREPSARDLAEVSLVLVLALVTSPISWTHYYLLLLLPLSLYLAGALPNSDDAAARWMIGVGGTLVSLPVVMLHLPPGWVAEILARTLVSAWLFGGLILFAALARMLWRAPASRSSR